MGHSEICCYRLLLLFGLLHRLIRLHILFGLEVEPVWYKNKIPSILG